jgi:hypothetical protein
MPKTVTMNFLKTHDACKEAVRWVKTQKKRDYNSLLKALIEENGDLSWGIWYLQRKLSNTEKIRLAIYSANSVLHIYEEQYPEDKRPREAIKAVRKYLKESPLKNKKAAAHAADAAAHAADAAAHAAAHAADAAADAATYAAYAAADAATYAADAAHAAADAATDAAIDAAAYAAYAAHAAADAATYAADAAKRELQIKILKYGIKLMEKKSMKKSALKGGFSDEKGYRSA